MGSSEHIQERLVIPETLPSPGKVALLLNRVLRPETLQWAFPESGLDRFIYSEIDPLLYIKQGTVPAIREKYHRMKDRPTIVLSIIGPSTGGKTTIRDRLRQTDIFGSYTQIVTTVTRRPRTEENQQAAIEPGKGDYNFVPKQTFHQMVEQGKFIEFLSHGTRLTDTTFYGTTEKEIVKALEDDKKVNDKPRLIFLPVNKDGVAPVKQWIDQHYPDVPFLTVSVIPGVTFLELMHRIIEKRGTTQAFGWRIPEAYSELESAGELADVLVRNPIEPNGPVSASKALEKLFRAIIAPKE